MAELLTVDQALERILAGCRRLPAEPVALTACPGRVLAEPILAELDLPPFANSAMDGFAVRRAELAGVERQPVVLPVQATIAAAPGEPAPLRPGYVSRIMTGAPLPDGADAVVPVELTTETGEGIRFTTVPRPGANCRPAGGDLRRGAEACPAGTTLGHPEIALLAALGRAIMPVTRRPRAIVITTGDELVEVDRAPGPGQLRDSSRYALPAQLAAAGCEVVGVRHSLDSAEALAELLGALTDLDLVLTCGGVSMGERDFVRPVFERLGRPEFWGVAIKPGKPLLFGRLGEALFFGLPGNPVSSMVSADVFVKPAIDRLLGRLDGGRVVVEGRLTEPLTSPVDRTEYVRVKAVPCPGGVWRVTPTGDQSSGRLTSMIGANAYAVAPVGSTELAAGEPVRVELFDRGPGWSK